MPRDRSPDPRGRRAARDGLERAPGQADADTVLADDRRRHHGRLLVPTSALPGLPHHRRRRPAEARLAPRRGRDGPYPGAVVPSCRPNAPFAELVCLSKSSVAEEYYAERSGSGSMNKEGGTWDWAHAPPLTAAPAIRAVRLTAARGRYIRSRPRRRNLLLNRPLRAGRTAFQNRKNCARSHILLGASAVETDRPGWSVP